MIPLYEESESQTRQRENVFRYHSPKEGQPARYELIREQAGAVSNLLNVSAPPSRELSLAQTHLEQAVMWANAANARNE